MFTKNDSVFANQTQKIEISEVRHLVNSNNGWKCAVHEKYLPFPQIPDAPPSLKRLKRLAAIDTTQLENLPGNLKLKKI